MCTIGYITHFNDETEIIVIGDRNMTKVQYMCIEEMESYLGKKFTHQKCEFKKYKSKDRVNKFLAQGFDNKVGYVFVIPIN